MIYTVKPDKTSYKTQFSPLITIYHNIDNNNIFKHIFESDFINDRYSLGSLDVNV